MDYSVKLWFTMRSISMDPSCFPHWRGSRISRSTAALPKRRLTWAFPRRAVAKPEGAGKQLNVKLLYRTTRDMSLTEEGQRLLEALAPALNAIEHAVGSLEESRHEPAGCCG